MKGSSRLKAMDERTSHVTERKATKQYSVPTHAQFDEALQIMENDDVTFDHAPFHLLLVCLMT